MARLEPTKEVIRRLFALSGNVCAFPSCKNNLVNKKGKYVGNICHIEAAEFGGERYNVHQSDENRRSFENLLLLCPNHHKETDDCDEYTADVLKNMKAKHEAKFLTKEYLVPDEIIDKAMENLLWEIKAIGERTEKNTEIILENQTTILQYISITTAQKDYLTREFENLKELKENKNYSAILKLLERYRTKDWPIITEEQKFKIDLNYGLVYLDLLEEKNAAEYLIELPKYNIKIEDAFSYAALGYTLLGNKILAHEYINKCLSLNSENENAILALLLIESTDKNIHDLEKLIPGRLKVSPTIALNIALKGQLQKEYETSQKWIEIAISNSKIDSTFYYDAKAHKASIILQKRQNIFKDAHNQFSETDIADFRQAEDLLQTAWNYFKDTELKKSRWYYLTNLSAVKKFLNKIEDAITDAETAVFLFDNAISYQNLILCLVLKKPYTFCE